MIVNLRTFVRMTQVCQPGPTLRKVRRGRMQLTKQAVTIRARGGVPTSLLWHGKAYTVSDTPTPLYGFIPDAPTHPLQPRIGWRFQGTAPGGDTRVFDVHQQGRERWVLVAVYR